MKRFKLRKYRSQSLIVEHLECRRLLSAVPNGRIELPNFNSQPDAFVQNHDRGQDQRQDRGRDSNNDQKRSGRDTESDSEDQNRRRTRLTVDRNNSRPAAADFNTNSLTTTSVRSELPVADATVAARPSLSQPETFAAVRSQNLVPRDVRNQSEVILPFNVTTLATFALPFNDTQVVATFASVESAPLPLFLGTTTPRFTAVSNASGDLLSAVASSVASYAFGDEDDQTPTVEVGALNVKSFGGAVTFGQMPSLIDTLPAVNGESTRLFGFDESASEDAGQVDDEDADLHTLDDFKTRDESEESPSAAKSEPQARAKNASTEIVFATAKDDEMFGGEVEMPETLASADDACATIPFDSIVPSAPQIDQIISQAPMIELGDNAEPNEEEPEPVSINIRAGVPLVVGIPAIVVHAAKRKQMQPEAQEEKERRGLRVCSLRGSLRQARV